MKPPRHFYQPLAIGAPAPMREIPVKLERMIHFVPPHIEKVTAKVPELARQVDVVLGNLEDAIPTDAKEAARKGFIAMAAMIFGGWNPIGAFGAALVFGFSDATQSLLSILGVDVPPQILNSVPYLVTIVVVAGVVGRVRGPAMAGQPYEQG